MSDNQQKSGFWTSLSGIITALGGGVGVAAILAAIFQATHPSTPTQSNTSPTNTGTSSTVSQQTEGKFVVSANSSLGQAFISKQSSPRTFHFFATGKWMYNPSQGYIGADGNNKYPRASENYKLPGYPEGALIVRQKDEYHLIGHEETLTLDPNEKVYFTINDSGDSNNGEAFSDNRGFLKVEWNCEDCKQ